MHLPTTRRSLRRLLLLSLLLASLPAAAATQTRTSAFAYDPASGLLIKEVIEPDNGPLCLVTEYTHDAYGNKVAATTRNCNGTNGEAAAPTGDAVISSRTSSSTFDPRGQFPVTSTNALGQSETQTFDPRWGKPLTLTGPNGLTTTWAYDGFGRKVLETRADGTKTKWDYRYCAGVNGGTDACPTVGGAAGAWLVRETPLSSDGLTPNGPTSTVYHDALNRVTRKETQGYDGNGTAPPIYQDTHYDSLGRPYMTSRPYYAGQTAYWTTTTYDPLGRPLSQTDADGSVSSTAYNGLTTTLTNAKGQTRTTVKNSQGQIVRVTDAQNQSLTYTYDPHGNLATTTDPAGNIVRLTYDLRGRKTQMRDPDMGTWTYAYDALGQLIRQTDAKGQVSTLSYDKLGRLVNRSEADLIAHWYYDTYKGGAACNKGIGKLCQSETSTGYDQKHTYDSLGRQTTSATTIDVPTPYGAGITYDAHGRLATQTYPTGLTVKYVYTALGYLKELRDNASGALYWKADARDAEGHLRQQTTGNGVQTTHSYDPTNGRLTAIQAGAGNGVQNFAYQYDVLGNLTVRSDANQSLSETFAYDSLNRLTSSTVNGTPGLLNQTFTYDALGNLTSKSDLGTYTYPASGTNSIRPHAVSQITLAAGGVISFAYDANGALTTQTQTDAQNNPVPGKGRAQYYTSFNMPQSMGQGTTSAAFYYGPDHQRVKQISSAQGTTVYLNPGNSGALFFEKDVKPDGTIEQRAFVSAGGQAVAIVKSTTVGGTTVTTTRYLHHDHLGSITAITDEAGATIERLAYEPFGKRRFATGANDPNGTIVPQTTDRGFTGHEMLDEIGLIHMNGRVYDPLVGRFLSADPLIQDPYSLQSYNRYSYCINNPVICTDPSGYSWLSKTWKKIWKNKVVRTVVTAVVAYYTGGLVSGWVQGAMESAASMCFASTPTLATVAGGAAGGFAGGMVASSGDLKAGFYGAVGGAIGGAFAGSGASGQMLGGGINGYLQTGTSEGFARGFMAGAIPQDLGFSNAYKNDAFANVAIGIARDGIRGGIVGGKDGILRGIAIGQATNAAGHLTGFATTGASPRFRDGSFFYEGDFWMGKGAITLGNVISGPTDMSLYPDTFLYRHERGHIPQSNALGALYIPAHALSMTVAQVFGGGHHSRSNLLENYLHQVPHNGGEAAPFLDWIYGASYR